VTEIHRITGGRVGPDLTWRRDKGEHQCLLLKSSISPKCLEKDKGKRAPHRDLGMLSSRSLDLDRPREHLPKVPLAKRDPSMLRASHEPDSSRSTAKARVLLPGRVVARALPDGEAVGVELVKGVIVPDGQGVEVRGDGDGPGGCVGSWGAGELSGGDRGGDVSSKAGQDVLEARREEEEIV
jgi:hypothetical protein